MSTDLTPAKTAPMTKPMHEEKQQREKFFAITPGTVFAFLPYLVLGGLLFYVTKGWDGPVNNTKIVAYSIIPLLGLLHVFYIRLGIYSDAFYYIVTFIGLVSKCIGPYVYMCLSQGRHDRSMRYVALLLSGYFYNFFPIAFIALLVLAVHLDPAIVHGKGLPSNPPESPSATKPAISP